MLREIKFRAWHKEEKEMVEVYWFSKNQVNCGQYVIAPNRDEVILMQFVGRKDEQKKEIYVGDIMEYLDPMKSKEEYARDPYTRVVVKWNSKKLCYENCFRGDIIGNIYKDSELKND